jgi:transcription-repair coupling factor (superfamily II helicase)
VLVVVPGERDAEDLADDISLFWRPVLVMPAWETLPFEHLSPNGSTMARRAEARHRLIQGEPGLVVVASVRAAAQRVSPSPPDPIVVERGDEVDLVDLARRLAELGYHRTDRVESRGEFAVRGGIFDVYPAQGEHPIRLDLFGDTVEEVRVFSVADQRSAGSAERLVAYPAREFRPAPEVEERAVKLMEAEPWNASVWQRLADGLFFPGMESWLPWFAEAAGLVDELTDSVQVVMVDPARSIDRSRELRKEEADLAETLAPTWGREGPDAADHPSLFVELRPTGLEMPPVPTGPDDPTLEVVPFRGTPGDPASVAQALGQLIEDGYRVAVAMDGPAAADRVASVLADHGLALLRSTEMRREATVVEEGIHRGFVAPGLRVAVLGERELAGRRRARRRSGGGRHGRPAFGDLRPGDYVVHRRHGIGRFEGLVTREMAGVERDYLVIAYAGEDRLYVPVDQLASVRPYTGGETPRLSRMGGKDWSETRSRVRKAVAAVAEEVVRLHRARARATGHAFSPDSPWQAEMEAAFPYEETPDQLTAIREVKADMESDRPMDRLVFGDVGYGKTEVAIRAAFKAVMDGKQVAVLCPTTLLAQQHHQTFSERFASYPIRVEMLSRFVAPAQARRIVRGIEAGEVDVVIGTHRLLSPDVRWKDLGLLVVDEEQRFGVGAKDRIKELKTGVDVLTLTATPIPRTLEMALTGIRDVSHIRTPPEDRHPILTFVGPYDEQAVAAAIRRELLREGQVFYVHNRVRSIDHALARLQSLVPDARYVVAHGQMSEGDLEQVMLDFWNREYDVMVATTIIESGLDLPQVNTLIVERADLLGLSQLYQLRGRVGRSSQRAYAYLFHPPDLILPEDAHRRLEAIGEATDLGSGFMVAMRDLEIRGAGSILGRIQSGHIAAVGFDLYAELVAEAVDELEGRPVEEQPAEIRIDLPVDAHLPDDYVPELPLRLEAYRRLASARTHEEVDDVEAEWTDRYGPIPDEARRLLEVAHLRVEAARVGLTEVVRLRSEVRLAPVELSSSQEVRLERIERRAVVRPGDAGGQVLYIPAPQPPVAGLIDFIRRMWPDS